jgi:putative endonuclease
MPAALTKSLVKALDRAAARLGRVPAESPHLTTGRRGEEAAYFHLRKLGYTIVARNWRTPRRKGELDLVGWDDGILCIIEVKTRSKRDIVPAELSVDAAKRDELISVGREFLRRMPTGTSARVDVVSVYLGPDAVPAEIALFKNCFAVR